MLAPTRSLPESFPARQEPIQIDDAHSLAERILVEEHVAYTEAIARVASGNYEIQGRRYLKHKP